MTCTVRVQQLCISQPDPSNELKILVRDIVTTYTPVWFVIKLNHYMLNVRGHLFKVVRTIRHFSDGPVIQETPSLRIRSIRCWQWQQIKYLA